MFAKRKKEKAKEPSVAKHAGAAGFYTSVDESFDTRRNQLLQLEIYMQHLQIDVSHFLTNVGMQIEANKIFSAHLWHFGRTLQSSAPAGPDEPHTAHLIVLQETSHALDELWSAELHGVLGRAVRDSALRKLQALRWRISELKDRFPLREHKLDELARHKKTVNAMKEELMKAHSEQAPREDVKKLQSKLMTEMNRLLDASDEYATLNEALKTEAALIVAGWVGLLSSVRTDLVQAQHTFYSALGDSLQLLLHEHRAAMRTLPRGPASAQPVFLSHPAPSLTQQAAGAHDEDGAERGDGLGEEIASSGGRKQSHSRNPSLMLRLKRGMLGAKRSWEDLDSFSKLETHFTTLHALLNKLGVSFHEALEQSREMVKATHSLHSTVLGMLQAAVVHFASAVSPPASPSRSSCAALTRSLSSAAFPSGPPLFGPSASSSSSSSSSTSSSSSVSSAATSFSSSSSASTSTAASTSFSATSSSSLSTSSSSSLSTSSSIALSALLPRSPSTPLLKSFSSSSSPSLKLRTVSPAATAPATDPLSSGAAAPHWLETSNKSSDSEHDPHASSKSGSSTGTVCEDEYVPASPSVPRHLFLIGEEESEKEDKVEEECPRDVVCMETAAKQFNKLHLSWIGLSSELLQKLAAVQAQITAQREEYSHVQRDLDARTHCAEAVDNTHSSPPISPKGGNNSSSSSSNMSHNASSSQLQSMDHHLRMQEQFQQTHRQAFRKLKHILAVQPAHTTNMLLGFVQAHLGYVLQVNDILRSFLPTTGRAVSPLNFPAIVFTSPLTSAKSEPFTSSLTLPSPSPSSPKLSTPVPSSGPLLSAATLSFNTAHNPSGPNSASGAFSASGRSSLLLQQTPGRQSLNGVLPGIKRRVSGAVNDALGAGSNVAEVTGSSMSVRGAAVLQGKQQQHQQHHARSLSSTALATPQQPPAAFAQPAQPGERAHPSAASKPAQAAIQPIAAAPASAANLLEHAPPQTSSDPAQQPSQVQDSEQASWAGPILAMPKSLTPSARRHSSALSSTVNKSSVGSLARRTHTRHRSLGMVANKPPISRQWAASSFSNRGQPATQTSLVPLSELPLNLPAAALQALDSLLNEESPPDSPANDTAKPEHTEQPGLSSQPNTVHTTGSSVLSPPDHRQNWQQLLQQGDRAHSAFDNIHTRQRSKDNWEVVPPPEFAQANALNTPGSQKAYTAFEMNVHTRQRSKDSWGILQPTEFAASILTPAHHRAQAAGFDNVHARQRSKDSCVLPHPELADNVHTRQRSKDSYVLPPPEFAANVLTPANQRAQTGFDVHTRQRSKDSWGLMPPQEFVIALTTPGGEAGLATTGAREEPSTSSSISGKLWKGFAISAGAAGVAAAAQESEEEALSSVFNPGLAKIEEAEEEGRAGTLKKEKENTARGLANKENDAACEKGSAGFAAANEKHGPGPSKDHNNNSSGNSRNSMKSGPDKDNSDEGAAAASSKRKAKTGQASQGERSKGQASQAERSKAVSGTPIKPTPKSNKVVLSLSRPRRKGASSPVAAKTPPKKAQAAAANAKEDFSAASHLNSSPLPLSSRPPFTPLPFASPSLAVDQAAFASPMGPVTPSTALNTPMAKLDDKGHMLQKAYTPAPLIKVSQVGLWSCIHCGQKDNSALAEKCSACGSRNLGPILIPEDLLAVPPEGSSSLEELCGHLEIPKWQEGKVPACNMCGDRFTAFRRDHHCRLCGFIFCTRCTSKFALPERFCKRKKLSKNGMHRVCYGCEISLRARAELTGIADLAHKASVRHPRPENTTTGHGNSTHKRQPSLPQIRQLSSSHAHTASAASQHARRLSKSTQGAHNIDDCHLAASPNAATSSSISLSLRNFTTPSTANRSMPRAKREAHTGHAAGAPVQPEHVAQAASAASAMPPPVPSVPPQSRRRRQHAAAAGSPAPPSSACSTPTQPHQPSRLTRATPPPPLPPPASSTQTSKPQPPLAAQQPQHTSPLHNHQQKPSFSSGLAGDKSSSPPPMSSMTTPAAAVSHLSRQRSPTLSIASASSSSSNSNLQQQPTHTRSRSAASPPPPPHLLHHVAANRRHTSHASMHYHHHARQLSASNLPHSCRGPNGPERDKCLSCQAGRPVAEPATPPAYHASERPRDKIAAANSPTREKGQDSWEDKADKPPGSNMEEANEADGYAKPSLKRYAIYLPTWEPIHRYQQCGKCTRKGGKGYHCHGCGRLFCDRCSCVAEVPEAFKVNVKPGRERVCDRCRYLIQTGCVWMPMQRPNSKEEKQAQSSANGEAALIDTAPIEDSLLKIIGKQALRLINKVGSEACADCGLVFGGLFTRRHKCAHCELLRCKRCIVRHNQALQKLSRSGNQLSVVSSSGNAAGNASETLKPHNNSHDSGSLSLHEGSSGAGTVRRYGEGSYFSETLASVLADPARSRHTIDMSYKVTPSRLSKPGDECRTHTPPSTSNSPSCPHAADNGSLTGLPAAMLNVSSSSLLLQLAEQRDPRELFSIISRLGEGSFGAVYKAEDKRTGDLVALKTVELKRPTDLQDLDQEIAFMKSCDSPYVVGYKGCYLFQRKLWIVMEYCELGSLKDLLEICDITLSEEEIAVVMRETLIGVCYLHANQKIHRDIKGANLLLCASGQIRLADFGVSCQLTDERQRRNTMIGTPYWMAPEILSERVSAIGYDNKADIWSLGITAMELAKGAAPLSDVHPMRAILQIPHNDPPRLPDPENWSKDFNDFLAKCLVKTPETRPSAESLLSTHPFICGAGSSNILRALAERNMKEIEEFREREAAETWRVMEQAEMTGHVDCGDADTLDLVSAAFPSGPMLDLNRAQTINLHDGHTIDLEKEKPDKVAAGDTEEFLLHALGDDADMSFGKKRDSMSPQKRPVSTSPQSERRPLFPEGDDAGMNLSDLEIAKAANLRGLPAGATFHLKELLSDPGA